jgi:hypothetical protein
VRQDHEYAVIGHSRTVIGRHLGTLAAALASGAVLAVGSLLGVAEKLGLKFDIPPIILWPLTAGAIFPVVHWAFNRYVWRWSRVVAWLKIPDLNGEWECEGESLDTGKSVLFRWQGTVTITQTWEKIWVNVRTESSNSHSGSAALTCEADGRCRLMYSYRNDPKIGEKELASHVGFAEFVFSKDLKTAEGDYFNNKGRYTFGRMRLTRED